MSNSRIDYLSPPNEKKWSNQFNKERKKQSKRRKNKQTKIS